MSIRCTPPVAILISLAPDKYNPVCGELANIIAGDAAVPSVIIRVRIPSDMLLVVMLSALTVFTEIPKFPLAGRNMPVALSVVNEYAGALTEPDIA
jgi:hypothetical protein